MSGSKTLFENTLVLGDPRHEYLKDQMVHNQTIFPAAGYVELLCAAGSAIFGAGPLALTQIKMEQALNLELERPAALKIELNKSSSHHELIVCGRNAGEKTRWNGCARAFVSRAEARSKNIFDRVPILRNCTQLVKPVKYYEHLRNHGLDYDTKFQVIELLLMGADEVYGEVGLTDKISSEGYSCHPALLDGCFQIAASIFEHRRWPSRMQSEEQSIAATAQAAAFNGCEPEQCSVYLPISIEKFILHRPLGEAVAVFARALRQKEMSAQWQADLIIFDRNTKEVCVEIHGFTVQSVTRQKLQQLLEGEQGLGDLFYEVAWQTERHRRSDQQVALCLTNTKDVQEQVNTLLEHPDRSSLLARQRQALGEIESLCHGYICRSFQQLGFKPESGEILKAESLCTTLEIVEKHKRLVTHCLRRLTEAGFLETVPDGWRVVSWCSTDDLDERHQRMFKLYPEFSNELNLLLKCGLHLSQVWRGKEDPLSLLFDDSAAEDLYYKSPSSQLVNMILQLALQVFLDQFPKDRTLRILEVGAGTGGSTNCILPKLPAERTEYVFTDVSPLFIDRARERFQKYEFVSYQLLDIEVDPKRQGFAPAQFDLVIAANVLHATRDLTETVQNVRHLLRPGGHLLLREGVSEQLWSDLTFGLLEGWWRFKDHDLRPDYPLLSASGWHSLLAKEGFPQVHVIGLGEPSPEAIVLGQATVAPAIFNLPKRATSPTWVILSDDGGIGHCISKRLSECGENVLAVYSDSWSKEQNRNQLSLCPTDKEAIAKFFADLRGSEIAGVIHLWGLNATSTNWQDLDETQHRSCGSVIYLIQALEQAKFLKQPKLWLVTQGAQRLGRDRVAVMQSPLLGLSKTIVLEHPELKCRLVDLDKEFNEEEAGMSLFEELWIGDDEEQVALRQDCRNVARLKQADIKINAAVESADPKQPSLYQKDATYLITGGLGGLGIELASHLAEHHGVKHIALISRKAPSRENQDRIDLLRANGTRVEVFSADVGNHEELSLTIDAIRGAMPPLKGIFHAAGALSDRILLNQTWQSFREVFLAKVHGGWHLHELTLNESLDHFVLFSSAVSLCGSAGQSNHAAANAFLDGLADYRRSIGLAGASINWGAWSSIGKGAEVQKQRGSFAIGSNDLSPRQAIEAMDLLLRRPETTQMGVFSADWSLILSEPESNRPWLSEIRATWNSKQLQKPAGRQAFSRVTVELDNADARERFKLLQEYVEKQVGTVLKWPEHEKLNRKQGFFDLGMDSLMSVELSNRFKRDFGTRATISAPIIFDHPTVDRLSQYLAEQLQVVEPVKVALGTERPSSRDESIAIIGLGCRFPGGANSPDEFWKILSEGKDVVSRMPNERWDVEKYYDADPKAPGRMYVRDGGFLNRPVDQFDEQFFGISPREAEWMDPQHRLLLEVAWEALEHAGIDPTRLQNSLTGMFIGIAGNDYAQLIARHKRAEDISAYLASGNSFSIAAGRLAYFFGTQGPCWAIDTACSSSLVAVHNACTSLRTGESDCAIAGGVSIMLDPETTITSCKGNMLSAEGRCRTFDAGANGFIRGEGCGIVVLKRLSDARRDGDNILAVIQASSVNQDGATSGLTVPNGLAQERLIRRALQQAHLVPAEIDVIEAHGTGTSLGDPIEVRALAQVFSEGRTDDRPLVIGSVKTNIGHVEAASGVAGLIKTVLSLQHGIVPAHLHLRNVNPEISLDDIPAIIPTASRIWARGSAHVRRAGVSAFGFSGTNAHVIVEEAPASDASINDFDRPWHVLTLSAKTAAALEQLTEYYETYLTNHPDLNIADVAFTANVGRAKFSHSLAVVAQNNHDLVNKLAHGQYLKGALSPGHSQPKVAFLFPAEGLLDWGVGRQLYKTQPKFKESLDKVDALFAARTERSLTEALYDDETLLADPLYGQSAAFALAYALAELWKSFGVKPDVLLGCALGEYALSVVAGVMSLEAAFNLIIVRARMDKGKGVEPNLAQLRQAADKATYLPPQARWISTVTGEKIGEDGIDSDYWIQNSRCPVQYKKAIEQALDEGCTIFVELGPPSELMALGKECSEQHAEGRTALWLPSLSQKQDDWPVLLESVSQLFVHGVEIDWVGFDNPYYRTKLQLPTYPFQRQRHWLKMLEDQRRPGETSDSLDELFYEVTWQRQDLDSRLPDWNSLHTATWVVLADDSGIGESIAKHLESSGKKVLIVHADGARKDFGNDRFALSPTDKKAISDFFANLSQIEGVIHLWGMNAGLSVEEEIDQSQHESCGSFLYLIQALQKANQEKPPRVCLVTKGAQFVQDQAQLAVMQSTLLGLGRALATEHPEFNCRMIDLNFDCDQEEAGAFLFNELRVEDSEHQVALRQDRRYVARLSRRMSPTAVASSLMQQSDRPASPNSESNGQCRRAPHVVPGTGQAEISVLASGLGVGHAQVSTKHGSKAVEPARLQFAGIVTAVGPGLSDFHVGDAVMGLGHNAFSDRIVTASHCLIRKPERLSFTEAAVLPEPFSTAYGCLCEVAKLQPGETVLIHEAAEAVGLAAIQIAQKVGATIFASALDGRKRGYLKSLGVDHVFDYSDKAFVDEIMSLTGRRGVDVLLNSLTGNLIPTSLGVVRVGGRFVEIGSRGIWTEDEVNLSYPDITYSIFSLDRTIQASPTWVAQYLEKLCQWYESGDYVPPRVVSFAIEQQAEATAYQLETKQIGVAALTADGQSVGKLCKNDSTYIVTGGLGAIGQELAGWLVDRGARHIALIGRHEPAQPILQRIERWRSQGVSVHCYSIDVGDRKALSQVLDELRRHSPPIRGVFHAAGALSDGLLINQTWPSLQEVFNAKVIGSWNLHELTLKDPLDHFVLCSAMASLLAPVGLSNYTAANAFLDGLSHYRRTIALPGLSINWGEWSGIGMAKITAAQRGGLAKGLSIKQALTCLEGLLHDADAVQVGIADMDWTVPGQGYDLPFLANTQITVKSDDAKPELSSELLAEFEDADTRAELLVLLQQYIEKQVRSVLKWPEHKDFDPDHDFFELGMDSLMAVELAYRFQSAFAGRVKVAAPTFYRHPQINSLSRYLAQNLQKPDENGLATHSADLPARLQEAILQSSEV